MAHKIDEDIARKIAAMQLNGNTEDIFILLDIISTTHINNLRAAIVLTFTASEDARRKFEELGIEWEEALGEYENEV